MELRMRRKELLMPRLDPDDIDPAIVYDGSVPPPRISIIESVEPSPLEPPDPGVPEPAADEPDQVVPDDPQVARIRALRQELSS